MGRAIDATGTGAEYGRGGYGSRCRADPRGDKIAALSRTEEGVAVARFDLAQVERTRGAWRFFRDRRPELYGALGTADGKTPVR